MAPADLPLCDVRFSAGDRVHIAYCDHRGRTRRVEAVVAAGRVFHGDSVAIAAPRAVFRQIGHQDHPKLAALRRRQPPGHEVGLVLIDECSPARPPLRLVVDNTRTSHG